MSGFPNKISRTAFGPNLQDKYPVTDPTNDIGAKTFNLLFHQTAGLNLVSPLGFLSVESDPVAETVTTVYQTFAWDTEGEMPYIVWTRLSTGYYSWSLPSITYPDEVGNQVGISFIGGAVIPQGLDGGNVTLGQYIRTGERSGEVKIITPKLTHQSADVNFLMILW